MLIQGWLLIIFSAFSASGDINFLIFFCYSLVYKGQFSIECHKTETKAITLTIYNYNYNYSDQRQQLQALQSNEPIRTCSKIINI